MIFACAPESVAPRRVSTAPDPLPHLTPAPNVQGDAERGRSLFMSSSITQPSGCGTCHTVRGVPGASGVVGPNLTNVSLRPTLAGDTIQNTPENMMRWIMDPPATKPGALMPKLNVTDAQARDLTAFLYSQPYNAPAR
jgi:cytochrome c1